MKTIITKLLVLILIINAVIPMTAFANDTFALYNRGEEVILENDLYTYNGDKYIHEKDLYLINLEWDGNTLSDMLKARSRYPVEGIIAASHSIAVKAEDVLRRFKISLPLVLLKEGRSGERISFIRYPEQSVAEKVFDYLAGEDSAAEFEKISPLFCELDSTRNFIK